MTYFFLFTIGPVQGFISQARKTRDLAAGSAILSELVMAGIEKAADLGATSIFPYWTDAKKIDLCIPNRFLVRFENPLKSLKEIGEAVETAVRNTWKKSAQDSLNTLNPTFPSELFTAKWKNQIETQWQIFWVFQEIDGDYGIAHDAIERLLGSIKNTRTFTQIPEGENGRKCALTGERDALVFPSNESHTDNEKREKRSVPFAVLEDAYVLVNKNEIQLARGEGLSASATVKRFQSKNYKSYPSTAEIATLNWLQNLTQDAQNELDCMKLLLSGEEWDAQLLFDYNLRSEYFNKNGLANKITYLISLKDKLQLIKKMMKQLNKRREVENQVPIAFTPYYAYLVFDADNMGKWLSGAWLKDSNQREAFHGAFAQQQQEFAQKAREYLGTVVNWKDKMGCTVYAGGDDFAGFVNLYYLFDVLSGLRKRFDDIVDTPLRIEGYLPDDKKMSFSAGIAIAHYKTPLREVIGAAHEAEKIAKSFSHRKDSFCIRVLKRSGEQQECVMPFGEKKNNSFANLEILKRITEGLQTKAFSNTYIKSIEVEILRLAARDTINFSTPGLDNVIHAEINRLTARAWMKKPELKVQADTMKKQLAEDIKALWGLYGIQNFLHALHISDFLHRQPDKN